MRKRVISALALCALLGVLSTYNHDRSLGETEAKQILEEYLDNCGQLGPDEGGAEYELYGMQPIREPEVYGESVYRFSLCFKPDVPTVGGRRVSDWAVTKDGKTIYEYDILNDIWVEGSVYGSEDFSQEEQEGEDQEYEATDTYRVSPNGRYRLEMKGEKSFGSEIYPEFVQMRDMRNEKVIWSDSAHVNSNFLWSEDSMYLAFQSSGDTWRICRLLDCNSGEELPVPDIKTLLETAKTFPPALEDGITVIRPLRWRSENTLFLEICWDADSPSVQRVKGTVEYQVDIQKYKNLKLEEELKG